MSNSTVAADRSSEILEATRIMMAAHDEWAEGDTDTFSDEFITSTAAALQVVMHGGDFPGDLIDLLQPFTEFAVVWSEYITDPATSQHSEDDGRPTRAWWGKYLAVQAAYKSIKRRQSVHAEELEPVAVFAAQFDKANPHYYRWIAIHYARPAGEGNYIGPFLDDDGEPIRKLIDQEIKEPGSVIEDLNSVTVEAARAGAAEQARKLLQDAKARLASLDDSPKEDPATVEELLMQGQYPEVIAANKAGVTVDDVLKIADELGIPVNNREADLLGAMKQDDPDADAREAFETAQTGGGPVAIDGDDLADTILSLAGESDDPLAVTDVLRALGSVGKTADPELIKPILESLADDNAAAD